MNIKNLLSLFAAITVIAFTSCDKSETLPPADGFKQVTFSLSSFNLEQEPMSSPQCAPSTRANDITATPTRLLVLDVVNGSTKQALERTTATVPEGSSSSLQHVDNVLSDLSLTLTYGTHDIYILAAVNPYVSYSTTDKTVLWNVDNRPSYTWAKKVEVTVSQSSAATESVTLPLVIGRVDLICTDAQDPAATKMQLSGKMCWTLDLTTMNGIVPTTPWTYSIAIPNTDAGKSFATYSFAPSSGNLGNLTFTALNSSDSEITSHTLPNVPVTAGYITRYTGLFYSNTQGFTLSTVNSWTGVTDKTY